MSARPAVSREERSAADSASSRAWHAMRCQPWAGSGSRLGWGHAGGAAGRAVQGGAAKPVWRTSRAARQAASTSVGTPRTSPVSRWRS